MYPRREEEPQWKCSRHLLAQGAREQSLAPCLMLVSSARAKAAARYRSCSCGRGREMENRRDTAPSPGATGAARLAVRHQRGPSGAASCRPWQQELCGTPLQPTAASPLAPVLTSDLSCLHHGHGRVLSSKPPHLPNNRAEHLQ